MEMGRGGGQCRPGRVEAAYVHGSLAFSGAGQKAQRVVEVAGGAGAQAACAGGTVVGSPRGAGAGTVGR